MEWAVAVEMSSELANVYVVAFLEEKLSVETKKQEVVKEQKRKKDIWKDLVSFMYYGNP